MATVTLGLEPHDDFITWARDLGLHGFAAWQQDHPLAAMALGLLSAIGLALGLAVLIRWILLRMLVEHARRSAATWDDLIIESKLLQRLWWGVPWILGYYLVERIPHLSPTAVEVFHRLAICALLVIGTRSLSALLHIVDSIYSRYPAARSRPIKGYLQVVVLVAAIFVGVAIVSIVLDRSPWILLSGLGAMTAVLLLVFRDTLLSLVAGIRLTTDDLIRVGDWIEMPQFSADGDVIEIALHSVKVQNWDRTFTVIPAHTFLEHSFRNWRGMADSGGRRIKRAFHVDLSSIRFLEDEEIERFGRFVLLRDYIARKKAELESHNRELGGRPGVESNSRRLTNVGTLRAYIEAYLRQHAQIHQHMTLLVRQLEPGPEGLPIEIYAFSREIAWAAYEGIQADIFDHILAVVPELGLRVFQAPSGADVGALASVGRSPA